MLFDQAGARAEDEPDEPGRSKPLTTQRESRGQWLSRAVVPHEPWLRQALRRKYPSIDLDELVQAAYLRLMATERVDHIKDIRFYFYRAAVSELIQRARRDQAVVFETIDIQSSDWAADEPTAEEVIDSSRALQRFCRLLERLPPRQRAVIELRRLEGLSMSDTARRLGASVSSIEKHQTAAMRQLSADMGRS